MHDTAIQNGGRFFKTYASDLQNATVLDIGTQNINGSLKDVCPPHMKYVGVDFVSATGFDVVLDDPCKLPFENSSVEVVVSSPCFEHSEMFWLVFLEVMRILRPRGLFYLNAPSNGMFHPYPVDCWRFYPDSGVALANWARRNGINAILLESYISAQLSDGWSDCVAVFLKDDTYGTEFPDRITDKFGQFRNGRIAGRTTVVNPAAATEDQENLKLFGKLLKGRAQIDALSIGQKRDPVEG